MIPAAKSASPSCLPHSACRAFFRLLTPLLLAIAATIASAAEEGFVLKDNPGEALDVLLDGRPVARYMYAYDAQRLHDTYKPYLHVLDAASGQPITKGPGGQFTHHRGIFIGYNRLAMGGKTYDTWHMSAGPQVHQRFLAQEASADRASFTSLVHWNDKSGKPLLEEQRTFVFLRQKPPVLTQIDAHSRLTAVAGDVVLDGDPEHAGLQYRPANEVQAKLTRYLFPAEGLDPRKDKDLDWVAESYVLDGKTYSVVQMNHPENPKDTVWSAYRDYGRFGAFPKATIAKGDSLDLQYRFRVLAGELPQREAIEQWQDEYAAP